MNFTQIESFYVGLIVLFSIMKISLFPFGNLTAPALTFPGTTSFVLVDITAALFYTRLSRLIITTSSWLVKEVITLDEYCLVIFTPYYKPPPPLWKVVANSMSYFL